MDATERRLRRRAPVIGINLMSDDASDCDVNRSVGDERGQPQAIVQGAASDASQFGTYRSEGPREGSYALPLRASPVAGNASSPSKAPSVVPASSGSGTRGRTLGAGSTPRQRRPPVSPVISPGARLMYDVTVASEPASAISSNAVDLSNVKAARKESDANVARALDFSKPLTQVMNANTGAKDSLLPPQVPPPAAATAAAAAISITTVGRAASAEQANVIRQLKRRLVLAIAVAAAWRDNTKAGPALELLASSLGDGGDSGVNIGASILQALRLESIGLDLEGASWLILIAAAVLHAEGRGGDSRALSATIDALEFTFAAFSNIVAVTAKAAHSSSNGGVDFTIEERLARCSKLLRAWDAVCADDQRLSFGELSAPLSRRMEAWKEAYRSWRRGLSVRL